MSRKFGIVIWALVMGGLNAPAQEVRPFALTDISGHFELRLRSEQESRMRQESATSWESEELQIREGLRLDLDGYVYHPRFVKFQVGGLFEGVQDQISESGVDTERNSFPLSGDFNLTFLEQHKDTLTLYGSRKELDVHQAFARTFPLQSNSFGASLSIRNWESVPVEVSYSHNSQQGSGAGSDINQTDDTFAIRTRYHIGERSEGDAEYSITRTEDLAFLRLFEFQQITLNNTTYLDNDRKIRLTGFVRVFDQSGDTNLTTFSARETLDWRHTDRLQTRYYVIYDDTETGGQKVQVWDTGASLTHRLYESLQTNAGAYVRFEEASFGTSTTYGGTLTEDYTKKLGDWGQLGLAARGSTEIIETQRTQTTATVKGETHVLTRGEPVTLGHSGIDTTSIVVTDERGVRIYSLARDYTIVPISDPPQILPLALGNIPDGATVKVNYRYNLSGSGTVLTKGGEFDARLRVGQWLSVYGRYGRTEQSQVEGIPATRLESLQQYAVGGVVTWRWVTVGAEYEDRESVFSPSTSLSEWVSVSGTLWRRVQAQISASHRESTFGELTGRTLETLDVNAMLSAQITDRSQVTMEAEYRQQTWDFTNSSNNLEGYGVRMGYSWRYRKVAVEANARLSKVEQRGQQEEQNRFDLVVRRDF
ncbi:MAG: hypothetical protein HZB26_22750 [Candidatus Hydrogenedentes bacterium]|nr:hypothetical protein [Candidatus Hydrogenedentota bacterium]